MTNKDKNKDKIKDKNKDKKKKRHGNGGGIGIKRKRHAPHVSVAASNNPSGRVFIHSAHPVTGVDSATAGVQKSNISNTNFIHNSTSSYIEEIRQSDTRTMFSFKERAAVTADAVVTATTTGASQHSPLLKTGHQHSSPGHRKTNSSLPQEDSPSIHASDPRKVLFTAQSNGTWPDEVLGPDDNIGERAFGHAGWAHHAFQDLNNPDKVKAYDNAIQMKKRKGEQVSLALKGMCNTNSPLQMAAALFHASQTSPHLKQTFIELLPYMYEPSEDDHAARDMINQASLLIHRLRNGHQDDDKKRTVAALMTAFIHTPKKNEKLPKKPDGTEYIYP
jgi:hypothetical protein